MARLCFIENRGKTSFWVEVARALAENGHHISWIIQNPVFAPPPQAGEQIVLPFPEASALEDIGIPEAVITDRGRSYFEAGSLHYSHYQQHIDAALSRLQPDIVIGEPTLFHELLAIAACRARNIPYLHPTMTRYPGGRFSIFREDSQIPAISSGDSESKADLAKLSKSIATGQALPSYMAIPSKPAQMRRKVNRAFAHLRTLRGRLQGERYNTPSLLLKVRLERKLKADIGRWNALARLPDEGPNVLYPLQMQPEANIDVWGRPFSDQTAVIREILSALPPQGQLLIKANPKAKYEVSDELIALTRQHKNLVLLPMDLPIADAHKLAIGAVTVSGTVGLEAVFGRGRCLSLRHPILEDAFPEFHAETPSEAISRLLESPECGRGDVIKGTRLLARFIADSFPGTINEPLYDPSCIAPENIEAVVSALQSVIEQEVL